MTIALFAIIGAIIKPGVGYWIIFSAYCALRLIQLVATVIKHINE